MNGWDLVLFVVTLLGLVLSLVLTVESYRDLSHAPTYLRPLGATIFRHELLRLLKQLMLSVAIGLMMWREQIGTEMVITIRNTLITAVAVTLAVNSLCDMRFRIRYLHSQKATDDRH